MKTIIKSKLIKANRLHGCYGCLKYVLKGGMVYREKHTYIYYDEDKGKNTCNSVILYRCPKCHYHEKRHQERFAEFKKRCTHPESHVHTKYSYIPGEAVMEPDYDECLLCGAIV